MTVPRFLPLYLGFAAAYLLSHLYRTVNAAISPELTARDNTALNLLMFSCRFAFGWRRHANAGLLASAAA